MARSPSRRGRGASDFGGTLGSLLRTTWAQAGAVREVLERSARTGRARLDEALGDRRRAAALAELGETVLDLVRRGELDLDELPEIRDTVDALDRLDAEGDDRAARHSERSRRDTDRDDDDADDVASDDRDDHGDDDQALRRAISGPLHRGFDDGARGPRHQDDEAGHARREATTQRLRPTTGATRPSLDERDVVRGGPRGAERGRVDVHRNQERGAADGTVSSATWTPPAAASLDPRVWRPVDPYERGQPEHRGSEEGADRTVERGRPAAASSPPGRLAPSGPEPSERADELSQLDGLPRAFAAMSRSGGISFDDDLEEYMHPDDVPKREPI
jgi:hypothetical protein